MKPGVDVNLPQTKGKNWGSGWSKAWPDSGTSQHGGEPWIFIFAHTSQGPTE